MRLLLLSDIHANLEALEACLAVAPAHDLIVNLGDVVGYNASPNEVCERVRALGGWIVRGNHDRACSGLTDLSEFNLIAAMSARWTQTALLPEHLEWLKDLPQGPMRLGEVEDVEFVHGSPRDEDEYVLNPSPLAQTFACPATPARFSSGTLTCRAASLSRMGGCATSHLSFPQETRWCSSPCRWPPESGISSTPDRWVSHAMATGAPRLPST